MFTQQRERKFGRRLIVSSLILVLMLVVTLLPNNAPTQEKKIVLDIYHLYSVDSFERGYLKYFMDEITKRSKNRITFKEHPSGEFGFLKTDAHDACVNNVYQIFNLPDNYLEGVSPVANGAYMPFLIENWDEAKIVTELSRTYLNDFVTKRWSEVQLSCNAFPLHQLMSAKPVRKLDDLRGYKIRLASSSQVPIYKALGATPVTIMPGEVSVAMTQGVVDGLVSNPHFAIQYGAFESVKYLYLMNIGSPTFSTWMSKKALESLPKDLQALFPQVGKEMENMIWKDNYIAKVIKETYPKHGVKVEPMPKPVLDKMKEIAIPGIWEDWAAKGGPECQAFLKKAREALKK